MTTRPGRLAGLALAVTLLTPALVFAQPVQMFVPSTFNDLTMGGVQSELRFALASLPIADNPPRPDAGVERTIAEGNSARGALEFGAAIPSYQSAIAAKPDAATQARAHLGLALSQAASFRRAESLASLNQALKLRPSFAPIRTGGGLIYCLNEDYKTAATWLREAVRLDPGNYVAQYWLGWTLLHGLGTGEAEAAAAFRAALKLKPMQLQAATHLGMVSLKAGRIDDAIAALQLPLKDDNDDELAYWFLGLAYLNANRRADAQAVIQRLQSVDEKLAGELSKIAAEWKPTAVAPVAAAATPARPSDDVCRSTFLDQLGTAGINPVRQMVGRRFNGSQQSAVPNSTLTRVEARGSACDDPRVTAVRYDFDTNGILQVVTYVWTGAPGAAPMFAERIKTLSLFYTLPPARNGRVQMDVPLGHLMVQDVAGQNQVLESYTARK